jgi:ketosteroid isomerase-like protein
MNTSQPTAGQLAQRSIDLINDKQPDGAAEIYSEDYVTVDPHGHDHGPEPDARGPRVFARIIGYLHTIFDDLHLEITESYDAGDHAATVVRLTGKYLGTPDRPGYGQDITMEQVHFWRTSDGKIVHHRFMENDADFERQLVR